jgi:hypothetical protein
MVHQKDARSDALEKLGAEVVIGDLLEIITVRAAMEAVDAAYFVWPVQPGLIHATVNFAQAAKEAGVKTAINLSQRSANRDSTSDPCRDSFIAEQVFNWSGVSPSFISGRPTSSNGCCIPGNCPTCKRASCACRSGKVGIRLSRRMTKAAPSRRS